MQMRHVIEHNGETAEFYIDFRDGKCLVLNVDNGVWKIYDNAMLGLAADQELSNNIKNTIYEDGLFMIQRNWSVFLILINLHCSFSK